eukprot:TRINITY_DN11656_c0_g1_i1.p1 TRINITY_DN11656_c0_g1~~TRINITY_DN11656_c0_g1_i1.p1  ORF type:complete len:426 (-),score=81.34 TRINITY_DN11656_c0_g1_i1:74-1351(-)
MSDTEDKPQDDVPTGEGEPSSEETEVLDEEPRNLILAIVSQLRMNMDLSRVPLPTFILEPRSMLEKLTDFMTHGELLIAALKVQDPIDRMVAVTKWYLSGFYIRPAGVKKPYNPILGETFRCSWKFDETTPTHYVSEQVSHHPPISALYISNRKEGFNMTASIHPRSKFLGTSAASILEGEATLNCIDLDEQYTITFPSVYARGILFGTLLMEMVGTVNISCAKTGLKTEIEFKAKPFFGGDYDVIVGKIKNAKSETLYTINGKWHSAMTITHAKSKQTSPFLDPKGSRRSPMNVRPLDQQEETESQRMWAAVTDAIKKRDQKIATDEKTKLEQAQREGVQQRKESGATWTPKLFYTTDGGKTWAYRYQYNAPYDPSEGEEREQDGIVFPSNVGIKTVTDNAHNPSGMSGSSSSSNPPSDEEGDN